MSMRNLKLFSKLLMSAMLGSVILSGPAPAATPETRLSTTRAKKKTVSKKTGSLWSGSLEMARSSSLYDLDDGSKEDGMDYAGALSYAVPTGRLSSKLSVSQDLNQKTEDTAVINDSHLNYSHQAFQLYEDSRLLKLQWNPAATSIIPLSKKSQKVEQLKTALITSATLSIDAGDRTNLHGLGVKLTVTAGQNFHEFDTDVNGKILNKYSSNQSISLSYKRGDFSIGTEYVNKIRWPYIGDSTSSFEFSQSIGYSFYKQWVASLGHTNSASTLKPNGYESNIGLVNEETSLVSIGLTYEFGG